MLKNRRKKKDLSRSLFSPSEKSVISEQFRNIRTNIQLSSIDKPIKSIIVSSSNASEGKSTIAYNLAVVYAQQHKRVLLIDADLRRPTLHKTIQPQSNKGLSTILSTKQLDKQCIQTTSIRNLDFITSGPLPPNPSELLGSKIMKVLLKELSSRYDFIIIDTSPVLPVSDAQLLANIVDGILIVIKNGQTRVEDIDQVKKAFMNTKAKLLGVILNQYDISNAQRKGYGY